MIKGYIYFSIISMILVELVNLRLLNKNINAYLKKNKPNKTVPQRIMSELRDLFSCWVPVLNILIAILSLYLILASELSVIKLLSSIIKRNKDEKELINKYLNE